MVLTKPFYLTFLIFVAFKMTIFLGILLLNSDQKKLFWQRQTAKKNSSIHNSSLPLLISSVSITNSIYINNSITNTITNKIVH